MAVIFKGVRIERNYKGILSGELDVKGDKGRMYLNLTETLCAQIMHLCADNIVEAAQITADEFRRECLQIEGEAGAMLSKEGKA